MCIFCEIINKKIKSDIVYEDAYLFAFLDIDPLNIGHTLIVPKKHSNNFIDDDIFNKKALSLASKISKILLKKYDGVNIVINTNEEAGQVLFHTHMHVIPRIKNDNILSFKKNENNSNNLNTKDEIIKDLKDGLND